MMVSLCIDMILFTVLNHHIQLENTILRNFFVYCFTLWLRLILPQIYNVEKILIIYFN